MPTRTQRATPAGRFGRSKPAPSGAQKLMQKISGLVGGSSTARGRRGRRSSASSGGLSGITSSLRGRRR